MVPHQHLDTGSHETLSALWRSRAEHLSRRGIAICIILGTLCAALPGILSRAPVVAPLGMIIAAFGIYGAVVQRSFGGRWLSPRGQHVLATILSAAAALAGLAAALLVLGAVFGGSIEVMRR